MDGAPRTLPATKIDMELLGQAVELHPDAYRYERAERFGCGRRGIGEALKRLKISRKKTLSHPKADEKARCIFGDKISAYQERGGPLIYIDESGFAHDMPRIHGYAPVGERRSGGRTNAVGALYGNGLLTLSLFDGGINADVFGAWIRQDLLPKLPENSVIVMDSASFHKRRDIQELITSCGHELEFLPPYSPDLNPIEHKRAQAKALRRKHRCSVDDLFRDYKL